MYPKKDSRGRISVQHMHTVPAQARQGLPLEVELQMVLRCLVGAGIKPRGSIASAKYAEPSVQHPSIIFPDLFLPLSLDAWHCLRVEGF